MELIHRSILAGKDGLGAPELCEVEMGDRHCVLSGETCVLMSGYARKSRVCLDPAWLKRKRQGGL